MLKKDIIHKLSTSFPEYTDSDLKDVLDILFDVMREALVQKRRVEIRGFGSFSLHVQKGRDFINPRNGDLVRCPSRYRIVFRAGKGLKRLETGQEGSIPSQRPLEEGGHSKA